MERREDKAGINAFCRDQSPDHALSTDRYLYPPPVLCSLPEEGGALRAYSQHRPGNSKGVKAVHLLSGS